MRFWDASAIVPLIADEPQRARLQRVLLEDPQMLVWWGTPVEVISAMARREREGIVDGNEVARSITVLRRLAQGWEEVVPSDTVRRTAERLLRHHPLRAADSLQLAAALAVAENDPASLEFVCLDERLTAAARREGFVIVDSLR